MHSSSSSSSSSSNRHSKSNKHPLPPSSSQSSQSQSLTRYQDSPSPSKRFKVNSSASASAAAMLASSSSASASSASSSSSARTRTGDAIAAAPPPATATRPSLRFGSNLGFMQLAKSTGFSSPSTLSTAALAGRSTAPSLASPAAANGTTGAPAPGGTLGSKHFAKKVLIRSLASKPVVPADFRDTTWAKLELAVKCIFTRQPIPPGQGHGLEDLYRACEALCLHKHAPWVYAQVERVLNEHAGQVHAALVNDAQMVALTGVDGAVALLNKLVSAWTQYTEALRLVRAVLLYLDRTYALPKGQAPLWELGLDAFLHHVLRAAAPQGLQAENMQAAAVDATIALIRAFRQHAPSPDGNGYARDQGAMDVDIDPRATSYLALIRAVADLLTATNQYAKSLEPAILQTTSHDFQTSSVTTVHALTAEHTSPLAFANAYLHYVHAALHATAVLATHLPAGTSVPLTNAVLHELVTTHRAAAILPGVPLWLAKGRVPELASVCRLLVQVGHVRPDLTNAVHAWARDMTKAILENKPNEMAREAVALSRTRAERLGLVAPVPPGKALGHAVPGAPVIVVSSAETIRIVEELMTLKVHLEWVVDDVAGSPMGATGPASGAVVGDVGHALRQTVDEAMADAINSVAKETHPAEKLAKYVDGFMKSKRTAATEPVGGLGKSTVDLVVHHVMAVFQYLKDKDTFLKFHKKDLARRLLQGTVTNDDAEKELVKHLSKERGHEVSEPLNKMFSDVAQSKLLRTEFRASPLFKDARPSIDLDVTVGQESVWPSDLSTFASFAPPVKHASAPPPVLGPNVHLPPELAHAMDTFNRWYSSAQKGRTLRWQLELGTVLIHAHYGKDLVCTMPMALVLLAFNEVPEGQALSFTDLATMTGLDTKVLRITLQSLSCTPKVKVLLKSPPPGKTAGEVHDTDRFLPVTKLEHKAVRIKLPSVVPKEVEELDAAKTRGQVETDRTGALDAAIVRVMKARKRLAHAELFTEVVKQCNFGVDASLFKKRVEDLMEREFLARADKEKNVYIYLP